MIWAGWLFCTASLLAASFARRTWHLILAQGVGYGIGFLALYYALLDLLAEWFVARRGAAFGVVFSAAGVSGTALSFILKASLGRFGFRYTLRGYAAAIFVLVGPGLPLLRARLPREERGRRGDPRRRVLRCPLFWFLSLSNLFQSLAAFLPIVYLPCK